MFSELLVFYHPTRTDIPNGRVIDVRPAGHKWGTKEHIGTCFLVVKIEKPTDACISEYLDKAYGIVNLSKINIEEIKNSDWLVPLINESAISLVEKTLPDRGE